MPSVVDSLAIDVKPNLPAIPRQARLISMGALATSNMHRAVGHALRSRMEMFGNSGLTWLVAVMKTLTRMRRSGQLSRVRGRGVSIVLMLAHGENVEVRKAAILWDL